MVRRPLDGILVDRCPNCRGVWLDGGELEQMSVGAEKTPAQMAKEAAMETAAERARYTVAERMCPRCQRKPLQPEHRGGVELDRCSACGGMHFDWGELERVLSAANQGFSKWFSRLKDSVLGAH
jgi:Zn-finger nucleic acid-binding protein